ncbi:hypothetical protein BOTBODRAFT_534573 [Botryobasidium botryosum FD-172 SS1]|uniref:Uncharacterized protein n=1 Tax=Botryobasidium botryosum (strain FD-172 SS1) TaxID=930990 RepID=A0A067M3D0_BOTB1|nr:hypothetical protein BOTBODRAFT_534573 [Botryobasidium botryosum FD-172 SS1]
MSSKDTNHSHPEFGEASSHSHPAPRYAAESEQLPSYDAYPNAPQAPPYPTELPGTFPVGRNTTRPLVTLQELDSHLRLLSVFDSLRKTVREFEPDVSPTDPDAKWVIFLARAVHRFDAWSTVGLRRSRTKGRSLHSELPPWDVLMVWHTYLLNPRIYFEDGYRRNHNLLDIGDFPLVWIASLISPDTHEPLDPAPDRVFAFESRTGLPFYPVMSVIEDPDLNLKCPKCEKTNSVKWHEENGKGYAQVGFAKQCEACDLTITHEATSVRKFFDDLILATRNPENKFMAGTLLKPVEGTPDPGPASTATQKIELYFGTFNINWNLRPAEWSELVGWRFSGIERRMKTGLQVHSSKAIELLPPRLIKVLARYHNHYTPSIELAGAVMRQGSFIQKMVGLGWTAPHRFDLDQTTLVRCAARYHAFLDLIASGPTKLLVPTLDIDLSWHTHQLKAESYREDTLRLVGRVPDHDDRVDEERLSSSFDMTSQAWRRRFGVPYNVCGCPQPAPGVSEKVKRFGFKLLPQKSSVAPFTSARPDLITLDDACAEGTHPSSHNSILFHNHPSTRKNREKRVSEKANRLEKARQLDASEKGDEWNALHVKRQNADHQDPFVLPYPYWGVSAPEFYGYGGCGAFDGSVIAECTELAGCGGGCNTGCGLGMPVCGIGGGGSKSG